VLRAADVFLFFFFGSKKCSEQPDTHFCLSRIRERFFERICAAKGFLLHSPERKEAAEFIFVFRPPDPAKQVCGVIHCVYAPFAVWRVAPVKIWREPVATPKRRIDRKTSPSCLAPSVEYISDPKNTIRSASKYAFWLKLAASEAGGGPNSPPHWERCVRPLASLRPETVAIAIQARRASGVRSTGHLASASDLYSCV